MADYMSELAQSVGLPNYPRQGPYGRKDGAVIGVRDGHLVAVGPAKAEGGRESVNVMVRFREVADSEPIRAAVEATPDKPSGAKITVGKDYLLLAWGYSLRKPKAPDVANLVKSVVDAIKGVAPGLDGRCEKCQSSSQQEIVLQNGVPAYFCDGCQSRIRQELDRVAIEYENLPSNFPKGLVFGIASALGGTILWGGVAYLANRIFLYGAILIGYLVGLAVIKGMGKITRAGQVLVFLLTLASVLLGDAFFFSLVAAKQVGVGWGMNVVLAVIAHFWEIETAGSNFASILFALIGAGYSLYRVRKPKFSVQFERLGKPAP